jgi:hypothetical protein
MQASYGTVPRDPGAPRVKPKISTMAKVIPCVFLCLYIPMVLLASHILRAEEQEEQVFLSVHHVYILIDRLTTVRYRICTQSNKTNYSIAASHSLNGKVCISQKLMSDVSDSRYASGDHWIDEATGKIVKLPCFLPDGSKCSGNDYKEDRELDRYHTRSDRERVIMLLVTSCRGCAAASARYANNRHCLIHLLYRACIFTAG